MTCGKKHKKNCPTDSSKVEHTEVAGRGLCIHPGCGKPILGDGQCVYHHSQDPSRLARDIIAEVQRLGGTEQYRGLAWQYAADALQVAEQANDPALLAEIEAALPAELQQARERGPVRLTDIPCREHVKRALEVAFAGGHPICLQGHPEETAPFAAWAKAQGISVYEAAPCRCGNYGDPAQECTCSWSEIARWRQRKDYRRARTAAITVEVARLSPSEQRNPRRGEAGGHVLARGVMAQHAAEKSLVPDEASLHLLRAANRQLGMGWVRCLRVLEVARTIARLADQRLSCAHVAEAIQYTPRRYQEQHAVALSPDTGTPLVFRDAAGQPRPVRLEDIPGQEHVKAALETALAGEHTVGIVVGGGAAGDLQPLVEWGRAQGLDVQMVTPCPCGCLGSPTEECTCSATMVARHRERSPYQTACQQDIVLTVREQVPWDKFEADLRGTPSRREPESVVFQRIAAVKEQTAPLPVPSLPPAGRQWLQERGLDAAAINRVLRIAETRARQDGATAIDPRHLAAALEWSGVASSAAAG